jgi:hypothetical protein
MMEGMRSNKLGAILWIVALAWPCLTALSEEASLSGKQLFRKHCMECHGDRGQGVADEYGKPLVGEWPIEKLVRYIDKTMPDYEPELVKGKDAEAVARFVFETFYRKPELFRKESKVQLARLTNRQFRQSLSDLFAQFEGQPRLTNPEPGLKAKYYNAEGMNKKKKMQIERIDRRIRFDFGVGAPAKGMNPKKFSIYWEGSLMPRETGLYEFFVRSPNGFALRVNKPDGLPTIDEKVTAGKMREASAKTFLLGGRPYPLRLEYYKFDDPNASIELSWKSPIGEKEILPTEFLFTKMVPHSFVSQQKLPPDDSSHGYERGIHVDDTWDEAVTFGILEAAEYAGDRMDRLARTNDKDENRRKKTIEFARSFVRLAFREKLSKEDLEFFVESRFRGSTPLQTSVEKVVLMALKSPRFLYPEWQALAKKEKDPFVVATRLALYLWDSIPDKKLLDMVDKNQLVNKWQIESQANRMLKDARSKAKFTDFMLHWLEIDARELPAKNSEFTNALAMDLRRSLLHWIEKAVWEEKAGWQEFLRMPKMEYNKPIAEYYGLAYLEDQNVSGFVSLDSSKFGRKGLHTHPYLLASHSYPEDSSPIHRGVFVSRKILGRTLRPPKEAVSFRNADFDPKWTMRQKVTNLTKPANCMNCHDLINSTGFTLEGFDATGRIRKSIAGKPIDLLVKYPDEEGNERQLKGPGDLLEHALQSSKPSKSFVEELCKHLAKQPHASYGDLKINELTEMLKENKVNLSSLYMRVAFQAATDGFEFQP